MCNTGTGFFGSKSALRPQQAPDVPHLTDLTYFSSITFIFQKVRRFRATFAPLESKGEKVFLFKLYF